MDENDMLGSGASYVSRGVLRARPRREGKKLGALWLVCMLGTTGLANASYKVAPGDNLTRIARRHGMSIKALAAANGIKNLNLVRTGSLLRIPASGPANLKESHQQQTLTKHRVKRGENLTRIAGRYRTTVSELVAINSMRNPGLLRAGQYIKVPGPAGSKVAGAGRSPVARSRPPSIAGAGAKVPVPVQPANLPPKPPTTTVSARPAGVEDLLELYSQKFGVEPALMKGLAWQESGWKQHVVSSAGAIGIMQVLPQTGDFVARHLLKKPVDLKDPRQNVEAGVAFYAFYLSKTSGDQRTAVAGYFQGLRSVWQNGISEGTGKYVESVFALRNRFAG